MSLSLVDLFIILELGAVLIGLTLLLRWLLQRAPQPSDVRIFPDPANLTLWLTLTRREKDVARLVARGLSNAEVGRELTIKPRTVDAHIQRIYSKLQVHSRAQLAHRYRQLVD